ncbi:MAG: VWA domain-containing protein, partial [Pseudomonadota bacterium]
YVWKDNKRRWTDKTPTWDVLHTFPSDYKVIFVGDASMSPYEITVPGGSVEYFNEEPGAVWLKRMTDIYESVVWLNPIGSSHWDYAPSIQMMKQLMSDRMYPLTLGGLDKAMAELRR